MRMPASDVYKRQIQSGVLPIRRPAGQRLRELVGHQAAYPPQHLHICRISSPQRDAVRTGQRLNLMIDIGDPAMLHADQPPADIQTTDAGQLPFIEYRNVGRSAADIQVCLLYTSRCV